VLYYVAYVHISYIFTFTYFHFPFLHFSSFCSFLLLIVNENFQFRPNTRNFTVNELSKSFIIFANNELGFRLISNKSCAVFTLIKPVAMTCCDVKDCVTPAKTLSYMVNSRHVTLITDAELSLLKVAQLERIHFHHQHQQHQQQQQQRHRTSSVSIQHWSRGLSTAAAAVSQTTLSAFYLVIVSVSVNIS